MRGRMNLPADRIEPQPWMKEPGTRAVLAALGQDAARFAGGAVRDALLGHPIADIDIATTLTPEEATRRLEAAGIKVVPTGLAHGTVTAVLPPRSFEITTLRRDVETFGRHARVQFTTSWEEDAARRDFTMNALYLDAEGRVFDPVGGLGDLRAGRVRFVGDARQRIREDVLRLLRFYRFHAHYGRGAADAEARAAARELKPLLPRLSAERVSGEMRKLLAASDPVPALRLMEEDGVLAAVLPEATALARLARLVPLEPVPDPLRRLAALAVTGAESAQSVAQRLKLATAERDRLAAIAAAPPLDLAGDERTQRRALYRLGHALYADVVLLRAAEAGDATLARALLAFAAATAMPRFPLKGRDVTARGVPAGPRVGQLLAEVEAWWEAGDFRADRRACLAELERRIGGRNG
jgi:poly(A) polymerase